MQYTQISNHEKAQQLDKLLKLCDEQNHVLKLGYPGNGYTGTLLEIFSKSNSLVLENKKVLQFTNLAQVADRSEYGYTKEVFDALQKVAQRITSYIPCEVKVNQIKHETKHILELLKNSKHKILLILDAFEYTWEYANQYFFEYLKLIDLLQGNNRVLSFLWIADQNLPWENLYEIFGDQAGFVTRNIKYIPAFDKQEWDYQKVRMPAEVDVSITDKRWKTVRELSGPQLPLHKAVLRGLKVGLDLAIMEKQFSQEIIWKLKRFEQNCSDDEWELLKNVAMKGETGQALKENIDFFEKNGVISLNKGKWEVNGLLLKNWIVNKKNEIKSNSLTEQQVELRKFFEESEGKMITREEIAEVLWGNQWHEHYSEWAIAQAIARLRKKLAQHRSDLKIKTLRGKGYVVAKI